MKYNFDQVIERRNTNCSKWDQNAALFGWEGLLDMWVADMDFPSPEPVVEAIRRRAEHPIFGYTFPSESLYEAIIGRLHRYYGWRVQKEWIVFTAGVVNGLHSAVEAFTRPGDEVIVQPPVYYPFYGAIKNTGRQVLHNNLKFDGARYTMDLPGLAGRFEPVTTFPVRVPRARALILCSPHNPVGRVWTREELLALGDICLKNDCLILSDEIHCDLLVKGARHTVMAALSEELERRTVTFMSASKTYNLAGLSTSFVIIPDERLRRAYADARAGHNSGNIFGFEATEAAFSYGDEYLEQLREYLNGNLRYFAKFIETRLPQLKLIQPEGTFLAWVDMRGLGMNALELQKFVREKAKLALDDGYAFGPGGEGFQRFNLACPRSVIQEALTRLEKAVNQL